MYPTAPQPDFLGGCTHLPPPGLLGLPVGITARQLPSGALAASPGLDQRVCALSWDPSVWERGAPSSASARTELLPGGGGWQGALPGTGHAFLPAGVLGGGRTWLDSSRSVQTGRCPGRGVG